MKAKSQITSVLEIFFSVLLFIIVFFFAAKSLLWMGGKSAEIKEYQSTMQCNTEVENKIARIIESGDNLAGSFFVLQKLNDDYKVVELKDKGSFSGFLAINRHGAPLAKADLVVKNASRKGTRYFSASFEIPEGKKIEGNDLLSEYIGANSFQEVAECEAKAEIDLFEIKRLEGKRQFYLVRIYDQLKIDADRWLSLFIFQQKYYES